MQSCNFFFLSPLPISPSICCAHVPAARALTLMSDPAGRACIDAPQYPYPIPRTTRPRALPLATASSSSGFLAGYLRSQKRDRSAATASKQCRSSGTATGALLRRVQFARRRRNGHYSLAAGRPGARAGSSYPQPNSHHVRVPKETTPP